MTIKLNSFINKESAKARPMTELELKKKPISEMLKSQKGL